MRYVHDEMMKMMSIIQKTFINQLSFNERRYKFRICMSQVKIFLVSILKLLHIVFFIQFLVLMSMSSDAIEGGIVIVLGI